MTKDNELLAALRASESRYRNIFYCSAIGIIITSLDWRLVDVNPVIISKLGYANSEEFFKNFNMATGFYAEPVDCLRVLAELGKSPSGASFETKLVRKDGSLFYAKLNLSMTVSSDDVEDLIIITIEDINDRVLAEIALRESQEKYHKLFKFLPDPILLVHLETQKIVELNDACVKMLGYSSEEVLGRTSLDLKLYKDIVKRDEVFERFRTVGHLDQIELEICCKDGSSLFCLLSGQVVEMGGREYATVVLRDVTEMLKMQALMVQTEKMISVGGLAAGLAHEINNPLGIVLQASQNIIQRCDPDFPKNRAEASGIGMDMDQFASYLRKRKIDVFIDDIQSAAIRASEIIRSMLNFSRQSERNSGELHNEVCNLNDIIGRALKMASIDYDLVKNYDFKRIKIECIYNTDPLTVNCNVTEIEQVLLNILRNAAQAMADEKSPTIDPVITIRTIEIANRVRVEIEDNGPGMPPEVQKRIFEPFFTTKPPGVGTGLGLSVSYYIINKHHGGTMSVMSRPGKGTVFIIELPVERASEV